MIEDPFYTRQRSGSGRRSLGGTPGRRLLRRRKEQIGWHTETVSLSEFTIAHAV
jgi:hypothetical protein